MKLVRFFTLSLLVTGCLLALAATASAAARSGLDRSFGARGTVAVPVTSPAGEAQTVEAMAAAPDGSSYALVTRFSGCAAGFCQSGFRVLRYLPNGSPDEAFNGPAGGAPVGTKASLAATLAVDPKGRPLVAQAEGEGFVVRRLALNGQPDPKFGSGGETAIPCGCAGMFPVLLVGGAGKIVVEGDRSARLYGPFRGTTLSLSRLLPEGGFDRSFGRAGRIQLTLPDVRPPGSVALGPHGAVFLAGNGSSSSSSNSYVSRITPSGGIDNRFNAWTRHSLQRLQGLVDASVSGVRTLVMRPHGRIDLLGRTPHALGFALRLRASGRLDRPFAKRGLRILPLPVTDAALDEAGGTFVVAEDQSGEGAVAFRLLPSDRMDPAFGNGNGIRVPNIVGDGGVSVATEPKRRAFVFDLGLHECRQQCPPTPKLVRFLAGPTARR